MNNKDAKELLQYIAENLWTESIFLTPQPSTNVEVIGLLDKIAELRGIDKEKNGEEFNDLMEKIERKQDGDGSIFNSDGRLR